MLRSAIFLGTCLATLEKEIHCMLKKTLQSRAVTCNAVSKQSMQLFQKVQPISTWCNRCKPKKLRDKLQRRHVTLGNPPVTCLTTPLQHKLQQNSTVEH